MSVLNPSIVDLDYEAVEDSRRMSMQQRLQLGGDLFDSACQITLVGIARENHGISATQAMEILRQRLEWAERSETRI